MPAFKEFKDSSLQTPVVVNPDYVVLIYPDVEHPADATVIQLSNGKTLGVEGKYSDVVKKLMQ
jgi:uncharacterized protein YlzI (FlbEa/FlbD family)